MTESQGDLKFFPVQLKHENNQIMICQSFQILLNIKGHSCKIGNMRVPGTSENQYCQFYEIHHFCLIFTFEYYTVAQKHIRQSYSSVNQHFMAYL